MHAVNYILISLLVFISLSCSSIFKKPTAIDVDRLTEDQVGDAVIKMQQDMLMGNSEGVARRYRKTLLHLSVASGNTVISRYVIKNGEDINAKDSLHNTPLHYAVSASNAEMVKLLIENGSAVNEVNARGQTPLHMATLELPTKTRTIPSGLPNNGAISSRFGIRRNPFSRNTYQFHYGLDIGAPRGTAIRATADGRVTKVGWKRGLGRVVCIEHAHGYSTVYAHCESIKAVYYQKIKKGDIIAAVGNTGNSTGSHCHYAIMLDGVYVNPNPYVQNEKTAAPFIDQTIAIIRLLKEKGANFNSRDFDSFTPLHYAVLRDIRVSRALIECGAQVNYGDRYGLTPLHYAASTDVNIASYLLQHGAYVNARTTARYRRNNGKYYSAGTTPLRIALLNEWLEMARLLCRYGAKE